MSSITIPPKSPTHTHTLILLHGRGSTGPVFSDPSLTTTTLATSLPTTKFIFPTAPIRRSTILRRSRIPQWFDNYSLDDPNERPELQAEGLADAAAFLRRLVDEEAGLLATMHEGDAYERVVVGGLSQGCAAAVTFVLAAGVRLGAFVGMSGWLPLERQIKGVMEDGRGGDEDCGVCFGDEEEEDEEEETSSVLRVVNHLRDVCDMEVVGPEREVQATRGLQTPVFLGHGVEDPKVSVRLGRKMVQVLDALGMDVTWKEYEGLGHWYRVPDEIEDIVAFLRDRVGVPGGTT
ncbi:predicted protein [Aspergillus terreus NIH2624]|uniref:Acyl-protein thioesterase 1 n=1 Tax=Aspergillus terreus (strain NIH 2624 / FGSC A1156) TaxID=341663 RepID=Q0CQ33_ASPTN|nr:uncharacterized protein ATEG_04201 [Aspergillus terreus NIH2624]EAU36003.1 predicted protein [Aspergillus terreus NIH2624]